MKKRILSLFLCLVMLVSLFPAVYAEGEADTDVYVDLSGAAADDGIVVVEPEVPQAADAPGDPAALDAAEEPGEADPAAVGADAPGDPAALDAAEEPGEADPAAVGTDAPGGPSETDAAEAPDGETPADEPDSTPTESPVRVVFVCEPEETEITVYDPAVPDEYGEPVVIEPEEDGSFLLLPGKYCYDAAAEGYIAREEEEFTVEAAEENAPPQEIRVTLEAAASAGTDDEIPATDDTADEPGADDAADEPDEGDGETPDADETADAPEESAAADASEAAAGDGTVRVVFACEPVNASITVFSSEADESGFPRVIAPEADGSWRLLPGSYFYNASAEGFPTRLMTAFSVDGPEADGSLQIPVSLNFAVPEGEFRSYASVYLVEAGVCGSDDVFFRLYSDGSLDVWGSEDGSATVGSCAFWHYERKTSIKTLYVFDGIRSLGYASFYQCQNLTKAQIPGSVTTMDEWVFGDCTSLKTIDFLGRAPVSIGKNVFYRVTATAKYNSQYGGWTPSIRQNYGGTITWQDKGNPVEAFVTRAYQQILNRAPDASGLRNWVNALSNGSQTGATLINGFVTSQEFRNRKLSNARVVEILYNVMLDRAPDSAGKANWTGYLDNGLSYSFIVNGFAGSNEFRGICAQYGINPGTLGVSEYRDMNPNVTFFVSRCYKLILNRAPDADGLNNWTYLLLTGNQTGATVVNGFVRSNEFTKRGLSNIKVVEILYNVMLNRAPDTDGKAFWVAFLNDGTTYSFIVNGFAGSQEFINLCASYGIHAGSLVLTDTQDRCGHLYSATERGNRVTLNWMAGVNPTSFTIRYGYSQNNLSGYVKGISGSARSYTLTGLKKNTTYYFALSTVVGQSTIASSRIISVKTGNYDGIVDRRALVIGEANCPGQSSVPGAQNAQLMVNMLSSVNGGAIRIASYVDLSKASILSLIPSAYAGSDLDDVSYFFISSHGNSSAGANRDAGSICTAGGYGEKLYLDELSSALSAVTGWVVVLVNTCGSGAGVYPYGTDGDQAAADEEYDIFSDQVISAFAAADRDMTLMQQTTYFNEEGEAVRVEETPYEPEDEFLSYVGEWKKSKFLVLVSSAFQENSWAYSNGSVFVYALSNAVGTSGRMPADTDGNRWATLQELYVYTYNTVTSWTGGKQHPKVYPANSSFLIFYR